MLLSSLTRVADLTKCMFLNYEPCMFRPSLTNMNRNELKYYPFISLNKCTGSCNVLYPKICVSKETKDIYVKVFNMITNKEQAKAMIEHIHVIVNANSIVQHVIQWNKKTYQKNDHKCQKDYSWNPSTCICENSKYLKSVVDTSVTECDEIVIVMNNLSTKMANIITTKKTNTITTNIRDCYILHSLSYNYCQLLLFSIIMQNKKV